jgi:hypothetical protein
MNPNNLLNPKNLLMGVAGGLSPASILGTVTSKIVDELTTPTKIPTRTTEDKPVAISLTGNEQSLVEENTKKTSQALDKMINQGLKSLATPKPSVEGIFR